MKKRIALTISIAAFFAASLACSFGPPALSSLKTSKDKDGKQEGSTFKGGETLYANAITSGGGKSTVKFTLVADDAPGMKKGDIAPGSEVKVDLPSAGTAQFHLTIPVGFSGGKFNVVADLLDEKGEKKDSKTASATIEAGPAPAAPPASSDDKDKDDH